MSHVFGMTLGRLRANKGMPAKHLAQLVGLHPSYITQVERGYRAPPKLPVLERLAGALGLSAEDARSLARMASHDRVLSALANLEVHTNATDLAQVIVSLEHDLTDEDYDALRAIVIDYMQSRTGDKEASVQLKSGFVEGVLSRVKT